MTGIQRLADKVDLYGFRRALKTCNMHTGAPTKLLDAVSYMSVLINSIQVTSQGLHTMKNKTHQPWSHTRATVNWRLSATNCGIVKEKGRQTCMSCGLAYDGKYKYLPCTHMCLPGKQCFVMNTTGARATQELLAAHTHASTASIGCAWLPTCMHSSIMYNMPSTIWDISLQRQCCAAVELGECHGQAPGRIWQRKAFQGLAQIHLPVILSDQYGQQNLQRPQPDFAALVLTLQQTVHA